jgi:hypothetical protein
VLAFENYAIPYHSGKIHGKDASSWRGNNLAMTSDPKSREEYLISYHDKLLVERKETTDMINNYLMFSYITLGITILIKSGVVSKLSAVGADVDTSKPVILDYIVILILLAYIVIDFHRRRLGRLFQEIRQNCLCTSIRSV